MNNFSNKIINARWLIIVATFIIMGATGYGAQFMTFKSDYKTFFEEDNQQLNDFLDLQKIYSKSDNVAIIVAPKDGNVFDKETLTAIWELTNESWMVTYSSRVDSISNFQYSYAEGDDLMIEDLILEADDLDDEAIARTKRVALAEPLLQKKLIALNGDSAVVNITIRLPGVDKTKEVVKEKASEAVFGKEEEPSK